MLTIVNEVVAPSDSILPPSVTHSPDERSLHDQRVYVSLGWLVQATRRAPPSNTTISVAANGTELYSYAPMSAVSESFPKATRRFPRLSASGLVNLTVHVPRCARSRCGDRDPYRNRCQKPNSLHLCSPSTATPMKPIPCRSKVMLDKPTEDNVPHLVVTGKEESPTKRSSRCKGTPAAAAQVIVPLDRSGYGP